MRLLILAGVEKGEVIPDSAAPKSDFLLSVKNCLSDPLYEIGDRTVKAGKISQQIGFVTRFLNEASQEIKIDESRLLKFFKENSSQRKFNRELCGKEP